MAGCAMAGCAMAGCGSTGLTLSQHYVAAIAAGAWDEARAHCTAILAEPARSDCLATINEAHRRPLADCADIAVDHWAQECRFQFAERAAAAGKLAEAFAACDGTPEFGRECSYHLIREVSRKVLDKSPSEIGDPFEGTGDYGDLKRAPDALRLFWKGYFRERLANDVVIDPTGCPDTDCLSGARDEMNFHLPRLKRAVPDFCTANPATLGSTLWAPNEITDAWVAEWRVQPCILGAGPALSTQSFR